MREILFRGKRVKNGEWVQGYYFVTPIGEPYIMTSKEETKTVFKVISETVEQFTGLTDKYGTKIFEGDILQCKEKNLFYAKTYYVVEYDDDISRYAVRAATIQRGLPCMNTGTMKSFTVIGNIHDNPELLEGNNE